MTLKELVEKYVDNSERVFNTIKVNQGSVSLSEEKIRGVIQSAKRYLEDAKYYREKRRLETSLAAIAYCEGLLDALRFLGAVDFSW
jgi:FAD synthetase